MSGRARRALPEAGCFLIVAAAYGVHFALSGYDRFYWDAQHYWELGHEFSRNGSFTPLEFDDPIRPYALPLLCYGLQSVADLIGVSDVTIMRIWGALLAATLGVLVAPRLARALFPGAAIGWWRVIALNGLVFLFWRDHFQFPLSDFPALLLASIAVIGFLRATPVGYVVAGAGFGLAAMVRPSYSFAAIAAVVAAAVRERSGSLLRGVVAPALVLVAVALVSLPQVAINHHHRGTWSPGVPEASETTLIVLRLGLVAQRAQTYVGPPQRYPSQLVLYHDPIGKRILDGRTVSSVTSNGDYARLVLANPPLAVASYALHVFNGLDVRYPTPYVRDLGERPLVLPVLGFTLLFLAVARLALPSARNALGDIRWIGIVLLLVPLLSVVAIPVDPRYYVSLHLLVYMLACFGPSNATSLLGGGRRRLLAIGLSYLVLLVVCLGLASAIEAQLEFSLD